MYSNTPKRLIPNDNRFYGALNLTGHNLSEISQGGGITSKRSHKHLFDSG